MKRIMIDMDNVITNPLFLEFVNEFLGTNYKLDDLDEYYLQNLITNDNGKFWDFVKDKNLYDDVLLFDDCYNVLEKLNECYDLYIVTAYTWGDACNEFVANTLRDKYLFLRTPSIPSQNLIWTFFSIGGCGILSLILPASPIVNAAEIQNVTGITHL